MPSHVVPCSPVFDVVTRVLAEKALDALRGKVSRSPDLTDRDRTLARMEELAREIGERSEVRLAFTRHQRIPAVSPTDPGTELAERLAGAAEANGRTLELECDRGGVSFPNFLCDPSGVPVLDGLGPGGGGMHTREECVDLQSLRRRIALIAEAILLVGR